MTSGDPLQPGEQLRAALSVDGGILTSVQVERLGLERVISQVASDSTLVRPYVRSPRMVEMTFVGLSAAVVHQAPRDMLHLACLAETRAVLALPPGAVTVLTPKPEARTPDGQCVIDPVGDGPPWALELDCGYTSSRVLDKVQRFLGLKAGSNGGVLPQGTYAGVILATTSRVHAQHLKERLYDLRGLHVVGPSAPGGWADMPMVLPVRHGQQLFGVYICVVDVWTPAGGKLRGRG